MGQTWTINIIAFLLDNFFVMWEYHNECLHRLELSYAKERQTALLTMRLKAVHSLYDKVLAADWDYFIRDNDDIQQFITLYSPLYSNV
eukprot:9757276-Ditylum_brightwellii.AAC.1